MLVRFPLETFIQDKDILVVGVIYQVIGTIYAVLIAFTMLGVWQNFSRAELSVQTEAFALLDLVRIMEASQERELINIRHAALEYLTLVVQQEWPSLKKLTKDVVTVHEISRQSSVKIMQLVQNLKPENTREMTIFGQSLALLTAWLDARRVRILMAKGNTAKALWPLLLTGAFFLFSFNGLYLTSTMGLWVLLLLGLSVVVGVSFYLIFSLDCPFAGKLSIDQSPFYWAISSLQTYMPEGLMEREANRY
jgi:DNA-directed RNA polymerase subunit F